MSSHACVREREREREPSSVRFTRHWGFGSYGQQSEPGHPTPPQSCKKNQLFFFCPVIPLTLCILSKCPHLSLTYGYNDNMYVFFIYTPSLKARSSNNWTKSADLCQAARFITYSDRERESERERKRARAPWPMIFGMSKVNHLFHNLFSTFAKNFINSRWELFKLSGRQIDRPTDRQMP